MQKFPTFCHFVVAEVAKCAKASCNTSGAFETLFPSNEQQQMLPCRLVKKKKNHLRCSLLLKKFRWQSNVQCNCATYASFGDASSQSSEVQCKA